MTLKLASHSEHTDTSNTATTKSQSLPGHASKQICRSSEIPSGQQSLKGRVASEYIIQKYLRFVHTGHISYVISVSSCTAVCTAYPILIWRCFLSLIFFTRILTIKSSCATACDPDHGRLRHSREGSFHSQWQRSCPRRKRFPKGSFNVAQRSHTH